MKIWQEVQTFSVCEEENSQETWAGGSHAWLSSQEKEQHLHKRKQHDGNSNGRMAVMFRLSEQRAEKEMKAEQATISLHADAFGFFS